MNLQYVTNIISDSYKQWKPSYTIKIDCQTGTGKTYFILNVLLPYITNQGKKLLYIHNRSALGGKIFRELKPYYKYGTQVASYQKIEEELLQIRYGQGGNPYNDFDYVVFDECHYLLQDSAFNTKVDIFYNDYFLTPNPQAINIFMSSTMQKVGGLIKTQYSKIISYATGRDYSYITPYYFKDIKDIINTIKNDDSDEKWLLFTNSIKNGKEYKKQIKGSKLVHSKGYNDSKANKKLLKDITTNDKFDCKCLIATKVLDNGIDLKDEALTNIVIIADDEVDFLQMLGRKRVDIDNPQQVNLYIYQHNINTFQSRANIDIDAKDKLIESYRDNIDDFRINCSNNLIKVAKHPSLFREGIDGKMELIHLGALVHAMNKADNIYHLREIRNDPAFLIKEQLSWINKEYDKLDYIEDVVDDEEVGNLKEYLDELVGKRLFKDEQKKLTKFILMTLTIGKNVDYRTKKIKFSTLEKIIRDDLNLEYSISKVYRERSKKSKDLNKRYIILTKLNK